MSSASKRPPVLITGSSSGIGAATAQLFSREGHPVLLHGRDEKKLQHVGQTLSGPFHSIAADISRADGARRLIDETVSLFPDLSIVINNAGAYIRGSLEQSTDQDWVSQFESNLLSVVRITRGLISQLKKFPGQANIVNISSTAGLRPIPGASAYTTVKASIISLTQTLALELAPSKIRVNCICPGVVETPLFNFEKMDKSQIDEIKNKWALMHPLGRGGKPEDIAWTVYQLCRPEASWITGVVLPVDGGIALK